MNEFTKMIQYKNSLEQELEMQLAALQTEHNLYVAEIKRIQNLMKVTTQQYKNKLQLMDDAILSIVQTEEQNSIPSCDYIMLPVTYPKPANNNILNHQVFDSAQTKNSLMIKNENEIAESALVRTCNAYTEDKTKCNVCGKNFGTLGSKKMHMMLHAENPKQFVCSYCNKKFAQKGNLKTHIRIHTKEAPFACVTCGKCFKQGSSLKRHMNIHLSYQPHICTKCKKGFVNINNFQAHYKNCNAN